MSSLSNSQAALAWNFYQNPRQPYDDTDPLEYSARIEAYFAVGGKGTAFDAKSSSILAFLQDARHAPDVVKMI